MYVAQITQTFLKIKNYDDLLSTLRNNLTKLIKEMLQLRYIKIMLCLTDQNTFWLLTVRKKLSVLCLTLQKSLSIL